MWTCRSSAIDRLSFLFYKFWTWMSINCTIRRNKKDRLNSMLTRCVLIFLYLCLFLFFLFLWLPWWLPEEDEEAAFWGFRSCNVESTSSVSSWLGSFSWFWISGDASLSVPLPASPGAMQHNLNARKCQRMWRGKHFRPCLAGVIYKNNSRFSFMWSGIPPSAHTAYETRQKI